GRPRRPARPGRGRRRASGSYRPPCLRKYCSRDRPLAVLAFLETEVERFLMDPTVKNLLYDRPRLYDLVFPDAEKTVETMCRVAFARYLPAPPTSVLDVGCGTGRHLEALATTIAGGGAVDTPEFKATSVSLHAVDRASRRLRRTRIWRIPGQPDVEDYAEYRLVDSGELCRLLEDGGFEVRGLYDNREFEDSDLGGRVTS